MTTLEEFKNDHDWQNAFCFAFLDDDMSSLPPESRGPIRHVVEVIAASPGERDGPDWVAIVRLDDATTSRWMKKRGAEDSRYAKRYAKVFAGCCYTGWDVQAGGNVEFYATLEEAISGTTLTQDEQERLYDQLALHLEIDPQWLSYADGIVLGIATAIEQEKRYDDMPVLADALADAGADDTTVGFFRSRSHWALKSLLAGTRKVIS